MIFREEGLRNLVAEVGADHMFYGTDFPFDWPVGIDFILNAKVLNDQQKEAILGGNLVKLLGLKPVSS
jgi:predicted TIM-barrel fold metal-dependent hydrolase